MGYQDYEEEIDVEIEEGFEKIELYFTLFFLSLYLVPIVILTFVISIFVF